MKIKTVFPYLVISICIGSLLIPPSCANTTTPPSGGHKDTLPPVLVRTTPPYNAVHFSGKQIELKFNEYVKISDAANQIYLSPPPAKRLQTVVRGKSVVVTFAAPLDTNTTYSLYFGKSIADNNEGNLFGAYTFSFSTGSVIDSLLLSGYVVDAQTLLPKDNITIMFHTQEGDTVVYKTLPRAIAKTDLWGYFAALNLKGVPYRVFAVEDLNKNYKYDDNSETVAFLDSLCVPGTVMVADSFAMKRIDPKDTLGMLARPMERMLYLFKEHPKRQVLREKVRLQPRHFFLTFSAPDAQINSLQIAGVDSLSLICEHSLQKDTLRYWIVGAQVPDTLKGVVNYMKTDSINRLSPAEEKFTLLPPKADTTRAKALKIDLSAKPEYVEQTGIIFLFSAYPVELGFDKMTLTYTTTRNEEAKVPFTFEKDTLNGSKYVLVPQKWTPAVSYTLTIPKGIFKDLYGLVNDSLSHKIALPEASKFGSISVTLKGGQGVYIVELLAKTRDRVLRSLHVPAGGKGIFPYLSDGNYLIRITEDRNGNGVWDTGSLDQRIQPERVRFLSFASGLDLIEIKNKRELEQIIDIEELFHHDAYPIIPAKTSK